MKKFFKILITLLLTLAILAGGTLGVLYFGFGIDVFDQSGWSFTEEGSTQYLDYHGEPLLEWQLIDGNWYYFAPADGNMSTGWLELEGNRYYLGTDGVRCSGWLTLPDGTYYLSPTGGAAATGWLALDGQRYYLDETGRIASGWQDIESHRYYLTESGNPTTGWLELEGSRYHFDDSGVMQTGWLETEAGRMYLSEDTGAVVTGWLETESGRCYINEDGYLATGWTDAPEGRYYLDENGYPTTGWLEMEDITYYLDDTGAMVTGWLEQDASRYYFQDDGAMAVGKVLIDGISNYFTSTGDWVVLVNTWNPVPEGYTTNLVYFNGWPVDAECYDPLVQMLTAMRRAGYSYTITSAYRSEATQQSIWDRRMANYQASGYTYEEALRLVSTSVAIPGTSEHHLGLAIDISGGHAWLETHCWEYGFIVRYPEGKTDITGIVYEPWHYRYVGKELAAELKELGLCMEEYMDMLTQSVGSDAGTASNPANDAQAATENAA